MWLPTILGDVTITEFKASSLVIIGNQIENTLLVLKVYRTQNRCPVLNWYYPPYFPYSGHLPAWRCLAIATRNYVLTNWKKKSPTFLYLETPRDVSQALSCVGSHLYTASGYHADICLARSSNNCSICISKEHEVPLKQTFWKTPYRLPLD